MPEDTNQREALEQQAEDAPPGAAFEFAKQQSHIFRDATRDIFLQRENPIGELTLEYGVF